VRALPGSKLQVVEFREVFRQDVPKLLHLEKSTAAVYRLQPTIPGFD
jgi:hypothetical protein